MPAFAIIVRPLADTPDGHAMFEVAFQGFQAGAKIDVSFWMIRNRTKDQPDGEKKQLGAFAGKLVRRGGNRKSPLFCFEPDAPPSRAKIEGPQIGFVLEPNGDPDDAFRFALEHDLEKRPEGEIWEFTVQVTSPKLSSPPIPVAWPRYALPWHGRNALATYDWHAGNRIRLYNDGSEDAEGNAGAFHDLAEAIGNAKHFIFIVDWSFHPLVVLTRKGWTSPSYKPSVDETIGALLVKKAREGVVVAIHAWNHAEQAADDQNNQARQILNWLATRDGKGTVPPNLFWRGGFRGISVTHHQKYVIFDTDTKRSDKRLEVGVFWGGLDLTKGRFDWPEHPILAFDPSHSDPKTSPPVNPKIWPFLHAVDLGGPAYLAEVENKSHPVERGDDWYNGELLKPTQVQVPKNGKPDLLNLPPREPWHDIHARMVGPTAWDFVREFVGRWNVRTTWGIPIPGVITRHDVGDKGGDDTPQVQDVLFKTLMDRKKFVQQWEPASGPFAAQMLRSIAKEHWHEPKKNPAWNPKREEFAFKLDDNYEHSIQSSYLRAISLAERFIYIETQYLIGSGRLWDRPTHPNVANQIPEKLVERIVERAKKKKPFHAYVLIPMFPEGDPVSVAGVAIRQYEWRTMWYMIRAVDRGVKEADKSASWTQYLSFYFLAQWHRTDGKVEVAKKDSTRISLMNANQRYMIYIHSKLMIVDDRYLIVGSANLNERSLAGNRDTEDCVAMWPSGPATEADCVREIQRLRHRLWDEHLGGDKPKNWQKPEEPSCVDAVRKAGEKNWKGFRTGRREGNGHLVLLPFELGKEGVLFKATVSFPKISGIEIPDGHDKLPDPLKLDDDDWRWEAPGIHALGNISDIPE